MGVSQINSTSWGISLRGPPDPDGHKEHPQRPSSNLELRKDTQNESKSIGPSCWLLSAAHAHASANTPCSFLPAKAAQQLEGKNPQTAELLKHQGLPHALF